MSPSGAIRVSLAPASAGPDGPVVVVEAEPSEPDDHRVRVTADGEQPVVYRVERAGAGSVVVIDETDPVARTAVFVGPADGDGRSAGTPRSGIERREVLVDGWRFEVDVEPAARATLREKARRGRSEAGEDGAAEVRAIIPGVVVGVSVVVGDRVSAGQQLLVVEAMKMQNELRSPRDGVVGRVAVGERETIEVGDLLVVIE